MHGAADFGGAIKRHEHLDDGDLVMESPQRVLALAKCRDSVSVFEGVPIGRGFEYRDQASLGAVAAARL